MIFTGPRGTAVIGALLAFQFALLIATSTGFMQMSVFCTGGPSSTLATIFGIVHLFFLVLFVVGALSLLIPWVRATYALLFLMTVPMLPLQAWLVAAGKLTCDLP